MQLVIIFIAIVVIMLIVSFMVRGTNLDRIKMEEDEKKLLEEERVRVESKGIGPRITVFPNSKIIITNKRIIISQKIIFSKKFRVFYILSFAKEIKEDKFNITKGVMCLNLKKKSIKIETEKQPPFIHIEQEEGLGALHYIRIYLKDPEKIKSYIT